MIGTAIASLTSAALTSAIVIHDPVALRAAPRDSAQQHAVLRQGELVEVRGERLDYLQVYDHQRERAGFVRASDLRRTAASASETPELLTVLRFVKDRPEHEALVIGLAALWVKAAPSTEVQGPAGLEVLEAWGMAAERLAMRASVGPGLSKVAQTTLAAHLEVAGRYGVKFQHYEHEGRIQVCYDGEVFRRVLALTQDAQQQARAALALTRPECADPQATPQARLQLNQWRVEVLDRVQAQTLPPYMKNRIYMRRASAWSALAYQQVRLGVPQAERLAQTAANRAMQEFALVDKAELPDEDLPVHNDAAMRVNASRWAQHTLEPALGVATQGAVAHVATQTTGRGANLRLLVVNGDPGQQCIELRDAKQDQKDLLFRRCTYGVVWAQSVSSNREGTAVALAVQPLEAWRELWLLRKQGQQWVLTIVPPAPLQPDLGYAEFAGWVPGGAQMLLAREARSEGRYQRQYAVLSLDSVTPVRQTADPGLLGAFARWQDPQWKRDSASNR